MRSDERRLLLSDGDLRQQARIGHREAVEIAVPSDGQRPSDESLLVDDLRVAQLLLGPHDVIDRVELVLQLDLLAAQVLDLGAADSHLLGQALHLVAHPDDIKKLRGRLEKKALEIAVPADKDGRIRERIDEKTIAKALEKQWGLHLDPSAIRAPVPRELGSYKAEIRLLDGSHAWLGLQIVRKDKK